MEDILHSSVENSFKKFFSNTKISNIESLTPDASSRRYFRIHLESKYKDSFSSVLAMFFTDLKTSELGGSIVKINDAVRGLGDFFSKNDVKVPEIFFTDENIFFIEDLGDSLLADHYILNKDISKYKLAIDEISKIQNIKADSSFFAFKRSFGFDIYRKELDEILDYTLEELSDVAIFKESFDLLCKDLSSFKKVLCHRDFHSWNIIIDQNDKLRVIDYQDALLATKYYDLVALINDRDTDELLGDDNYFELVKYFYHKLNKPGNFISDYSKVLLQRDLKVVGRFSKLDKIKKINHYSKWIPGTVRRIFVTLRYLSTKSSDESSFQYAKLLTEFEKHFPSYLDNVTNKKIFLEDL